MRLVLCLLLSLAAAPALAAWVRVGETAEMVSYYDSATIRKDGSLRTVWEIQDLKKRHKDGEMSRRGLYQYDCKEKRYRILSTSEHSDSMAGGKILISGSTPSRWVNTAPNTASEKILKIVCAN